MRVGVPCANLGYRTNGRLHVLLLVQAAEIQEAPAVLRQADSANEGVWRRRLEPLAVDAVADHYVRPRSELWELSDGKRGRIDHHVGLTIDPIKVVAKAPVQRV